MSGLFDTHYILPFTVINGRVQRAACGRYVLPKEHSAEPTCATCKAYVEDDAKTQNETAEERFGAEFDPLAVVKHVPFNPTAGYKERSR